MAKKQVGWYVLIDYDDEIYAESLMRDGTKMSVLFNVLDGQAIFPGTTWRFAVPQMDN